MAHDFRPVDNGQRLDRDAIPRLAFEALRTDQLLVACTEAPESWASSSAEREVLHLFERVLHLGIQLGYQHRASAG